MKILALIPARAGSKKIPIKNIKLLLGKPLIQYSIEEAEKSDYINKIIVSTDSNQIADIAKDLGAEVPFLRPDKLSKDDTTDLPVFEHCLKWLKKNDDFYPDIIIHLRPTAPLRTVEHIDAGIEKLINYPEADSVRSITEAPKHPLKMWIIKNNSLQPFLPEHISNIKESYNLPRQSFNTTYIQNGSVDVAWTKTIINKNSMTGDVILPLVMNEEDSINIDNEIDFIIAELLIKRKET